MTTPAAHPWLHNLLWLVLLNEVRGVIFTLPAWPWVFSLLQGHLR